MSRFVDIVMSVPPGPDSQFVEAEDEDGHGLKLGEWVERQDGTWALRIWRHDFERVMPEEATKAPPPCPACLFPWLTRTHAPEAHPEYPRGPHERCWANIGSPCGREGCPETCELVRNRTPHPLPREEK